MSEQDETVNGMDADEKAGEEYLAQLRVIAEEEMRLYGRPRALVTPRDRKPFNMIEEIRRRTKERLANSRIDRVQ